MQSNNKKCLKNTIFRRFYHILVSIKHAKYYKYYFMPKTFLLPLFLMNSLISQKCNNQQNIFFLLHNLKFFAWKKVGAKYPLPLRRLRDWWIMGNIFMFLLQDAAIEVSFEKNNSNLNCEKQKVFNSHFDGGWEWWVSDCLGERERQRDSIKILNWFQKLFHSKTH